MEKRARDTERLTVQVRETEDGSTERVLIGRATPYNELSVDLGGFREMFLPGAFGDVSEQEVMALWSHDTAQPMGKQPINLRVTEERDGVHFRLIPVDESDQRVRMIEDGIVSGVSIGFQVPEGGDEFVRNESGEVVRQVREARLLEISPVVFPAYPQTDVSVAMRSLDKWRGSQGTPTATCLRERYQRLREIEFA